ncbi:MAG: chorismate mutase, partial [Bacteroidales bacterium]|nr:chorismate mutase [Bacteroidales bacterium]
MIQEARKIINEVDKEMAALFQKRMEAVREIAKEKIAHSLPIEDKLREQEVIERNREYISDKEISGYYTDFLQKTMEISKNYQLNIQSGVRVAYCGVEGAFAHIAAMKIFK